ncbi:MAG: RDD family protein [Burkholderiaceae bacterium]
MAYEAVLLFGVVFIGGWLFDVLTQSHHALTLRHTRQTWLFLVVGAYFAFFWCRSGQTLAMKTWDIRVVERHGARVELPRAMLRYLLAWLWFMPAVIIDAVYEIKGWPSVTVIALGMLVWSWTVCLDSRRQFLHDRLAGTCLTDVPKIDQGRS